jgi:hypothetical protein|tara:strand:- start:2643 stop:3947 length:1305 start_codon:yes stop_codon:yes gene_type:complete
MKKQLSGWGKNTLINTNIFFPKNLAELKKNSKNKCIARGLGRSYGDSSIHQSKTIITTNLKKIIYFDKKKGTLEAESGISIEEILNVIVKEGWFLPVTPGSKKVTLGGMIASDVHGKNHHKVGSFSNYILSFKLLNNKRKIIECSKKKNFLLYKYTLGGMGLTGIIYTAKIKLEKIYSNLIFEEKIKNYNLKETLKCINLSKNWEYNVAWIDTSTSTSKLGRSIVSRGYFLQKNENELSFLKNKSIIKNLPNIFPTYLMSSLFIKILNFFYFTFSKPEKKVSSIDTFFYPLDKINNWNIVYGKKGFISYQCSLPLINSYKSIYEILKILKKNKIYSFVSVLKSMRKNNNFLSFGQKGFTLVFDFPIYSGVHSVLTKIDNIVLNYKGKIYLSKDSRVSKEKFSKINNEFDNKAFKSFRKKINYHFSSIQSKRLGI